MIFRAQHSPHGRPLKLAGRGPPTLPWSPWSFSFWVPTSLLQFVGVSFVLWQFETTFLPFCVAILHNWHTCDNNEGQQHCVRGALRARNNDWSWLLVVVETKDCQHHSLHTKFIFHLPFLRHGRIRALSQQRFIKHSISKPRCRSRKFLTRFHVCFGHGCSVIPMKFETVQAGNSLLGFLVNRTPQESF